MAIGDQIPRHIEVRDTLDELGWSQVEAGERLMVARNTVHRWVHGLNPVPGPALAYLRLMRRARRAVR